MELLDQIRIERECGRLPLLFARYADNGDHAALARLFTEDCEFARPFQPDHPFYGRDRAIMLDPAGRPDHSRADFLRDRRGAIEWLRIGGRLLRREA